MPTDAQPEPADKPETKPRAKRRWYQFGLRSMLVWVTVSAVLLAVGLQWIAPAQRQGAAVQMIERLGGSVQYADPPTEENRLTAQLRNWLPRDYFDSVEQVEILAIRRVGDQELRCLRSLPQLHDLSLEESQFAAGCLKRLSGMTHLTSLSLDGSRITDAELVHLSGMLQIQKLDLRDTQVTDNGLAHLSGLKNLQELFLDGTQITDAGLSHLHGMKELKQLCLCRTNTTEAGLDLLFEAIPGCSIYLRFRE